MSRYNSTNPRLALSTLILSCWMISACGGGSSDGITSPSGDPQNIQQDQIQIDSSTCAESVDNFRVTAPTLMRNFTSDCDYFLSGDMDIGSDLTIEAGTTIIMDKDAAIRVNRGRIIAVGSQDNRITIRGDAPLAGYWNGITIIQARPSRVEYVDIMDGGQEPFTGRGAGLSIISAAVSLVDMSVSNSYAYGLNLPAGAQLTAFSNNRFYNNRLAGLTVYPSLIPELDTETDYFGVNSPNDDPVVSLGFSTVSLGQVSWPALNAPYADNFLLIIRGEELILSPGAKIVIYDNNAFSGFEVAGKLIARGTPDAPIDFSAAPGRTSWPQLVVSGDSAVVEFDNVVFREAENGIVLEGSPQISISNTRFEAIEGYVINCEPLFGTAGSPTIEVGQNVSIPDTADGLINPNCAI